ncbi:dTDP-4-dehydrorhamnose 3,5-epimerase [Malaciobacter molluscorum LMG 25693]|uniref:dTDP-4-dehydrorhamnose 3,5-epimerase n=1 Tax=Malaciobacter molluscorum LMG 25693 TaxID=870501 RepID=A0A2G1DJQ7_9BACT|nr:dTDP-4-dehydrorhamnose 3,5-epimerase [Malaciobacter molluscorum]AXX92902.1 dTDP-4-dehydrorhamnose 3,5-epimerase [Malaciobacter molluscorum LMG 25693]PHO18735.1 dTDP-4-dehydrorhamnose 3,5-epimerase [Malaciobacter molluscorum LMG 25693]
MNIINTSIDGLKIFEPKIFEDERGTFIKTFNDEFFQKNGLNISIKETYCSISHKDVIRGMHFQTPPHEHLKVVYVSFGKILDVVLDIRKNSPTYGESFSIELSNINRKVLIIPEGLAHGFKSLVDNTNVICMQTSCYSPENDSGIRYDSFNFNWDCEKPIISKKDQQLSLFGDFKTPFVGEYN